MRQLLVKLIGQWRYRRIIHRIKYALSLGPLLNKQLYSSTELCSSDVYKGKRVMVPLIETSHYQYMQVLIIAKALHLRGADVRLLLCGEFLSGCEIKSTKNILDSDPCWRCRFNSKNIVTKYGMESLHLSDYVSPEEVNQIDSLVRELDLDDVEAFTFDNIDLRPGIEDSVIRYFYGNVPSNQDTVNKVRLAHTRTAVIAFTAAKNIGEQWDPDIVFTNMSSYSAWDPFYRYYLEKGNFRKVVLSQFNFNALTLNDFDLYRSTSRFEQYVASRNTMSMDAIERSQLDSFIKKRVTGQAQIFLKDKYFLKEKLNLKDELKIDESKRNIFLFANIYWDVGVSESGRLYTDVIEWVLDTIDFCSHNADCHLYVKPHPGEIFDSSQSLKTISDFVSEKYPTLPENVTLLYPDMQINTYDLFPYVDLGVIYNGTLGLEMMLSDIPVSSTGQTTYQGLGFALEPETKEEYINHLNGYFKDHKPNKSLIELYAYFYFIKTSIPFNLTKTAYGANEYDGYTIKNLSELLPGKDLMLDHLCDSIMNTELTGIDNWKDKQ